MKFPYGVIERASRLRIPDLPNSTVTPRPYDLNWEYNPAS
jgi:hypothetical protein